MDTSSFQVAPRWSLRRAIASLLVASVLAAFMSEILVGAAQGTGEALGMSEVFIGIVFLAIVGGAAGPPAAIVMALRNKLDPQRRFGNAYTRQVLGS